MMLPATMEIADQSPIFFCSELTGVIQMYLATGCFIPGRDGEWIHRTIAYYLPLQNSFQELRQQFMEMMRAFFAGY
jgi:hypothetical protein